MLLQGPNHPSICLCHECVNHAGVAITDAQRLQETPTGCPTAATTSTVYSTHEVYKTKTVTHVRHQTVYATKLETVVIPAVTSTVYKTEVSTVSTPEQTTCPVITTTAYETKYASAIPATCAAPMTPVTQSESASATTTIYRTKTYPAPVASMSIAGSSRAGPVGSDSSALLAAYSSSPAFPAYVVYSNSPVAPSNAPPAPAPVYSSAPVASGSYAPAPYPVAGSTPAAVFPSSSAAPSSPTAYTPSPFNPNAASGLNSNVLVAAFGTIAAAAFML